MKIKYFVNLLLIYKPIKLQALWDVFWQHNPNQRSHGLAFLTSLMAHIQSFEVLSTKCIWSSDSIFIGIQLTQLKLDLSALVVRHKPLLGSQLCWSISHLCSTTLKHLLKSLMPFLETKNAR
jgi:hypothetical protein